MEAAHASLEKDLSRIIAGSAPDAENPFRALGVPRALEPVNHISFTQRVVVAVKELRVLVEALSTLEQVRWCSSPGVAEQEGPPRLRDGWCLCQSPGGAVPRTTLSPQGGSQMPGARFILVR